MSVNALVTGLLHAASKRHAGGIGKPYVRAAVVAHDGEADSVVSAIAFGSVADQLAALGKGDAISASGRARGHTWVRDGQTRAGLSLVADGVLTLQRLRQRRHAIAAAARADADGERPS